MLNGTGVGQFEGVTVSPAFISVAKESAQTADTIVAENIQKMRARCWGYDNAVWLANHDTIPSLAQLQGGDSANIWQPRMTDDIPDRITGRPVFFSEYPATLGDANDILCLNMNEYLVGTLQGLQSAESTHVRFVNHERTFKFWLENDGRGWGRSALTPKRGATLSPFVGLAERA